MGSGFGKIELENEQLVMEDLTQRSDEELETIVRRAENTNISGSLFQRAKIELELRDRKRKQSPSNKFEGLKKRIKRGSESWNFIYIVYAVLLGLEFSIIQVLQMSSVWSTLAIIVIFFITSWLCLRNPWFQNKLIGLKIWLEGKWGKL